MSREDIGSMRNVGLIGFGAIGSTIVELWPQLLGHRERLASLLVRPAQISHAAGRVNSGTFVTADAGAFVDSNLDVVIEAAGHSAVAQYGELLLGEGHEVHILSAGALADQSLCLRLERAARHGGGRIVILPGALAGFDGLLSMRASGLASVKYTSIKPVDAWRGTPAEDMFQLQELAAPQVIFAGSAREAATAFPRNANLAAAIALAGLGFEKTRVELIADPHVTENTGRLEAESNAGTLDVRLVSASFSENPKTSKITAMSALAALHDRSEFIRFC